ncbi:hypothetical protein GQ457_01G033060 [Hibiscus cannabinus]
MKRCDLTLDIRCATLALTAWYKCDKHALTLSYSDPSQLYCHLCENERQPGHWFCDNSLHSYCALGNKVKFSIHRHQLTPSNVKRLNATLPSTGDAVYPRHGQFNNIPFKFISRLDTSMQEKLPVSTSILQALVYTYKF